MLQLSTPRGLPVRVPQTLAEDPSPHFSADQLSAARAYYDENGYVVVSALVDAAVCDEIRRLWDAEIKPSQQFIYRQATAKAERHVLNENGWVMNPILNLQSVDPGRFPQFRECATQRVLGDRALGQAFSALLDDRPKIVQSMYFEGNSATWEHQDTYYLDSENIGTMAAAWIAIEDIDARAGRFFLCPGSHKLDMGLQSVDNNVADKHDVYIRSVVDRIIADGYEIRAPLLNKGDVLFWNARTVHGSLNSQDTKRSRSSITCHAISARDKFLQLQTRAIDVSTKAVNDALIYCPKDQAKLQNRLVMGLESHFGKQFYWLKKNAVRAMIKARSGGQAARRSS